MVAQWVLYWLVVTALATTGYLTIVLIVLPRRLNIYQIVALIIVAAILTPVTIVVTLSYLGMLLTRQRGRYPHLGALAAAIFLVAAAGAALDIGAQMLAPRGVVGWALAPALFLLYFYLFPAGRFVPKSTRWLAIVYGLTHIGQVFSNGATTHSSTPDASFMALWWAHLAINTALLIGDVIVVGLVIIGIVPQLFVTYQHRAEAGAVSIWGRARHAQAAGAAAAGVAVVVVASLVFTPVTSTLAPSVHFILIAVYLALVLLPVPAALAVLSPRPYDAPALAHRALLYGVLTAALIAVYAVCAALVTAGLFFAGGLPPMAVLIGTAAMAAVLRPVRATAQRAIEARGLSGRPIAPEHIAALGAALGEQVYLDPLCDHLVAAVRDALRPESLTLWLRTAPSLSEEAVRRMLPPGAVLAPADPAKPPIGTPVELQARRQVPNDDPAPDPRTLTIAAGDPLYAALTRTGGALDIAELPSASPAARVLGERGASLAVHLSADGDLLGVLALGPRAGGARYTFDDREALDTLTERVSPALRVALLVHERDVTARERDRVEQELATARRIQLTLLPKETPALDGWEIATHYQPARAVGGDFYDFLPFADGRLGVILGDVTDKGVPAALVMATTRSMLRAAALETTTPGAVLARVNDLLYADLPSSMFVTCFYAVLDPPTGRVVYANAGQDLPYLRRADGCVAELRATGMPLGLMPEMAYEEREDALAPGDGVLFYSDGLVEAHDPAREMFGFPRLVELLATTTVDRHAPAALLSALADFTGPGWEQEDDVTLVALRRYG